MSSSSPQAKESPKLSQSELELGQKWDRCLQDVLIKIGSGVGLGIVFSVVLFRSRQRFLDKFLFTHSLIGVDFNF